MPRVIKASNQTEKSYIYLHQQMRRLAQDLSMAAHTAENIRDTLSALHNTSYDLQEGDNATADDE